MKKEKPELRPLEIQPLTGDVFANLSIEELEERLELQILHIAEAQLCYDCGSHGNCTCNGFTCSCNSDCAVEVCGAECQFLCGVECATLCAVETCIANTQF